eukprot:gene9677-6774_t
MQAWCREMSNHVGEPSPSPSSFRGEYPNVPLLFMIPSSLALGKQLFGKAAKKALLCMLYTHARTASHPSRAAVRREVRMERRELSRACPALLCGAPCLWRLICMCIPPPYASSHLDLVCSGTSPSSPVFHYNLFLSYPIVFYRDLVAMARFAWVDGRSGQANNQTMPPFIYICIGVCDARGKEKGPTHTHTALLLLAVRGGGGGGGLVLSCRPFAVEASALRRERKGVHRVAKSVMKIGVSPAAANISSSGWKGFVRLDELFLCWQHTLLYFCSPTPIYYYYYYYYYYLLCAPYHIEVLALVQQIATDHKKKGLRRTNLNWHIVVDVGVRFVLFVEYHLFLFLVVASLLSAGVFPTKLYYRTTPLPDLLTVVFFSFFPLFLLFVCVCAYKYIYLSLFALPLSRTSRKIKWWHTRRRSTITNTKTYTRMSAPGSSPFFAIYSSPDTTHQAGSTSSITDPQQQQHRNSSPSNGSTGGNNSFVTVSFARSVTSPLPSLQRTTTGTGATSLRPSDTNQAHSVLPPTRPAPLELPPPAAQSRQTPAVVPQLDIARGTTAYLEDASQQPLLLEPGTNPFSDPSASHSSPQSSAEGNITPGPTEADHWVVFDQPLESGPIDRVAGAAVGSDALHNPLSASLSRHPGVSSASSTVTSAHPLASTSTLRMANHQLGDLSARESRSPQDDPHGATLVHRESQSLQSMRANSPMSEELSPPKVSAITSDAAANAQRIRHTTFVEDEEHRKKHAAEEAANNPSPPPHKEKSPAPHRASTAFQCQSPSTGVYPSSLPVSPYHSEDGTGRPGEEYDDTNAPTTAHRRRLGTAGTGAFTAAGRGGRKKRQRIKKHAVKIHAYATPPNAYYPSHPPDCEHIFSSIPEDLHTTSGGCGGSPVQAGRRSDERHPSVSYQQLTLGIPSPQTPQFPSPAASPLGVSSSARGPRGWPNNTERASLNLRNGSMANNSIFFNNMSFFRNAAQRGPGWGLDNDESINYSFISDGRGGRVPTRGTTGTGVDQNPWNQNVIIRPPRYDGRRLEAQRYSLPPCPPYRIPLYDQAVFKYVFDSLYANHLTLMQVLFLLQAVAMFALNLAMTVVNVMFAVSLAEEISRWIVVAASVCFILEFAVAALCLVLLVVVMAEAVIFNNIGTSLAHDISLLVTLGGTFSVLRLTGLATPLFALRRIVPLFQRAVTSFDYFVGVLAVIFWIFIMFATFVVLIAKMSQIYFALVLPVTSWSIMQYVRLVGLCVNLSRVDDSYFKEMSVLLDACHRHYAFPGEAEEAHPYERPCLVSRIRIKLHIPMYMYFTLFDTIYNFHWRSKYEREGLILQLRRQEMDRLAKLKAEEEEKNGSPSPNPTPNPRDGTGRPAGAEDEQFNSTMNDAAVQMRERAVVAAEENAKEDEKLLQGGKKYRKTRLSRAKRLWLMFNYLAFIFEVDPVQLRRYLQMVQSPLPFYQLGRESFLKSFQEGDLVGMNTAVRNSEPQSATTALYAKANPKQFFTSFTCDDGRHLWDTNKCIEQWNQKDLARTEEMIQQGNKRLARVHLSVVPSPTGWHAPPFLFYSPMICDNSFEQLLQVWMSDDEGVPFPFLIAPTVLIHIFDSFVLVCLDYSSITVPFAAASSICFVNSSQTSPDQYIKRSTRDEKVHDLETKKFLSTLVVLLCGGTGNLQYYSSYYLLIFSVVYTRPSVAVNHPPCAPPSKRIDLFAMALHMNPARIAELNIGCPLSRPEEAFLPYDAAAGEIPVVNPKYTATLEDLYGILTRGICGHQNAPGGAGCRGLGMDFSIVVDLLPAFYWFVFFVVIRYLARIPLVRLGYAMGVGSKHDPRDPNKPPLYRKNSKTQQSELNISDARYQRILKFQNQLWLTLFYVGSSVFGYQCQKNKPWFTFPVNKVSAVYYHLPAPYNPPPEIVFYYCYGFGFYASELFSLLFIEKHMKRVDFLEYFFHHITTLALIFFSHVGWFHRFGGYTLFIHDASDICLSLSKSVHYVVQSDEKRHKKFDQLEQLKLKRNPAYKVQPYSPSFAFRYVWTDSLVYAFMFLFITLFFYFRWLCLPSMFLASGWLGVRLFLGNFNVWMLVVLLNGVLQGLHIYWGILIIVMVYNLLRGEERKDIRSDDDESEDEFAEEEEAGGTDEAEKDLDKVLAAGKGGREKAESQERHARIRLRLLARQRQGMERFLIFFFSLQCHRVFS